LLGYKADQAARQDRDEGDLDESDEMPLGPLEDGVQPTVAADPGQRALNHSPNPLRNEGSAVTAGTGLDGDAKRLADLGQPLASIAEIAQGCSLEAAAGKLMQHRNDALAVMDIRRRDVDRQREAVFNPADSSSVANTLRISCRDGVGRLVHQRGEHLVGGREAERLARPTVEPGGDRVEFGLREHRQVSALG
jgi:hypothetical protein